MTKSFVAALFAATLMASGAAFADGPAPLSTASPVATQTIVGVPTGQGYPDFGPASLPPTSGPIVAQNGQQYPEFGAPDQSNANRAYAQNVQRLAGLTHNGGFGAMGDRS